jgi:hypothetical protein
MTQDCVTDTCFYQVTFITIRCGGHLYAPSDISGASTSSGRKSLVEDPSYLDMNLTANNIYMRPSREQFPEHIIGLVDQVHRDPDSPGPPPE